MMATATATTHEPTWKTHPEAYQLVCDGLAKLKHVIPMAETLSHRMLAETGTTLLDWTDRLTIDCDVHTLRNCGYQSAECHGPGCYRHPTAQLPVLMLPSGKRILVIKVESVVDFLEAHQFDSRQQIHGNLGAAIRRSCIHCTSEAELWVIERHGNTGWQTHDASATQLEHLSQWAERFRMRRRNFETDAEGFTYARNLITDAIREIGRDRAADLFFAAERSYWQQRNDAGSMQRLRQGRLGLGWANHDHHTYRSSRAYFHELIQSLELLGMECRERFYAGREAGWGAQVMEHPTCGVVVFADVDLAPDEIVRDFAHQALPPRHSLGTVGLWCALHGEAFLTAGLHHLECQFDFDAATEQLNSFGIPSMNPFTNLHHLKQAFTVGQRWTVDRRRAMNAAQHGWITQEQAEKFVSEGAMGSHLEILQRRDGYKGFNPKGISDIITETDPRNH
jgi:hypothetical protein